MLDFNILQPFSDMWIPTLQPSSGVEIDFSHQLSKGITGYWMFSPANFGISAVCAFNLADPKAAAAGPPQNAASAVQGLRAGGYGLLSSNNANADFVTGLDSASLGISGTNVPFTMFARVQLFANSGASNQGVIFALGDAGAATNNTALVIAQGSVSETFTIGLVNTGSADWLTATVAQIIGSWFIVFVFDGTHSLYSLNGATFVSHTNTQTTVIPTGINNSLTFCNYTNTQGRSAAGGLNGIIYEAGVATRAWTQADVNLWFNDPFCFLRPAKSILIR